MIRSVRLSLLLARGVRSYSTRSVPELNAASKVLRPQDQDPSLRKPLGQQPRASKNPLSDYDIYDDLATPLNAIEGVLENGFKLASGRKVVSVDSKNRPQGLVLLGTESFQVDLTGGISGLEKGFIELDESVLGVFDVVNPKPQLLVVGLGSKSRVLGPNTSSFLHSLGIQTLLSNTVNGCSNFDMLATERPGQVAALLFPPDL
ncbi:hypothetical protein TRVA0_022S02014 [Trichomonascus vanleenenianus]|uniref:uncharacterized protein n=1 Tax=Trichomonascus vanleenenianus TaxID=2268995 RepID=UPI003ECA5A2D